MIEQVPAWRYGNTVYPTFREAQLAGLKLLFDNIEVHEGERFSSEEAANIIHDHKDEVVAILTGTKPRRKRSDVGKPHAKPEKVKRFTPDNSDPPAGVAVEASSKYKGK